MAEIVCVSIGREENTEKMKKMDAVILYLPSPSEDWWESCLRDFLDCSTEELVAMSMMIAYRQLLP